jgi:hypothetical protein
MPIVLYGCETWSLTLREEYRLRVFENKVLTDQSLTSSINQGHTKTEKINQKEESNKTQKSCQQ